MKRILLLAMLAIIPVVKGDELWDEPKELSIDELGEKLKLLNVKNCEAILLLPVESLEETGKVNGDFYIYNGNKVEIFSKALKIKGRYLKALSDDAKCFALVPIAGKNNQQKLEKVVIFIEKDKVVILYNGYKYLCDESFFTLLKSSKKAVEKQDKP